MFSFIKVYLLLCVSDLDVVSGQKSLLNLVPDVRTLVDSKVFEANIWT